MPGPNPIRLSGTVRAALRADVERLLRRRLDLQLTQAQVANLIGCTSATFRAWEHGDVVPTLDAWLAWLSALDTSSSLGLVPTAHKTRWGPQRRRRGKRATDGT